MNPPDSLVREVISYERSKEFFKTRGIYGETFRVFFFERGKKRDALPIDIPTASKMMMSDQIYVYFLGGIR